MSRRQFRKCLEPLAYSKRSLTACSDPREYLNHVMKATNMSCLTPEGALSGDCDFLSANMYARSLFGQFVTTFYAVTCTHIITGEDALANLSVERTEDGSITGHVRIRSKTQGIALSLGDRITMGKCFELYLPTIVLKSSYSAKGQQAPGVDCVSSALILSGSVSATNLLFDAIMAYARASIAKIAQVRTGRSMRSTGALHWQKHL